MRRWAPRFSTVVDGTQIISVGHVYRDIWQELVYRIEEVLNQTRARVISLKTASTVVCLHLWRLLVWLFVLLIKFHLNNVSCSFRLSHFQWSASRCWCVLPRNGIVRTVSRILVVVVAHRWRHQTYYVYYSDVETDAKLNVLSQSASSEYDDPLLK